MLVPWGTWSIIASTGSIVSVEFAGAIPLFETDALAVRYLTLGEVS